MPKRKVKKADRNKKGNERVRRLGIKEIKLHIKT